MNHMTASLKEVAAAFTEDGRLDQDEVGKLAQRFFHDAKIDRDEADTAFEINDRVSKSQKNAPTWPSLFAAVVTAYVLEDGRLDDGEASYLQGKISADGSVDNAERTLLQAILTSGAPVPASFRTWAEGAVK